MYPGVPDISNSGKSIDSANPKSTNLIRNYFLLLNIMFSGFKSLCTNLWKFIIIKDSKTYLIIKAD